DVLAKRPHDHAIYVTLSRLYSGGAVNEFENILGEENVTLIDAKNLIAGDSFPDVTPGHTYIVLIDDCWRRSTPKFKKAITDFMTQPHTIVVVDEAPYITQSLY